MDAEIKPQRLNSKLQPPKPGEIAICQIKRI